MIENLICKFEINLRRHSIQGEDQHKTNNKAIQEVKLDLGITVVTEFFHKDYVLKADKIFYINL